MVSPQIKFLEFLDDRRHETNEPGEALEGQQMVVRDPMWAVTL